jgi:hypothetical protein
MILLVDCHAMIELISGRSRDPNEPDLRADMVRRETLRDGSSEAPTWNTRSCFNRCAGLTD